MNKINASDIAGTHEVACPHCDTTIVAETYLNDLGHVALAVDCPTGCRLDRLDRVALLDFIIEHSDLFYN